MGREGGFGDLVTQTLSLLVQISAKGLVGQLLSLAGRIASPSEIVSLKAPCEVS